MKPIFHIILCILIMIGYYHYIKLYLFKISPKIAIYIQITKYYSLEKAKGVIELPLVVISHCIFVLIVSRLLHVPFFLSEIHFYQIIFDIPIGILLGIGMMGFSSMLCRAVIEILRNIPQACFPSEVKDWLIMTRSGWLRHYLHTLEVLPYHFALFIIFMQVCCEEMIFRSDLIHYFVPQGSIFAVITSVVLFMLMQLFHMPSLVNGIFPLVGSMIIGLVNAILYLKYFNLLPLLIAHFTFFVAAVL